jgi:N-formylglutamate deformylase
MEPYLFRAGPSALLVSMPHVGTHIPAALAADMTEAGRGVPDTDWHVDRLYDFLDELGASVLQATLSRFVIDLNRPPDGAELYAGARNTELCPTTLFDDRPIYQPGRAPDPDAVAERRRLYWQPYHDRLAAELEAVKARHGYALLFDAHSIRSVVPRFFEGRLWDFNVGSGDGAAASAAVTNSIMAIIEKSKNYTGILNGRFKGGYITRHYGQPAERVEAVQLELSQIVYMEEDPPFRFREDLSAAIRPLLRAILESFIATGRRLHGELQTSE